MNLHRIGSGDQRRYSALGIKLVTAANLIGSFFEGCRAAFRLILPESPPRTLNAAARYVAPLSTVSPRRAASFCATVLFPARAGPSMIMTSGWFVLWKSQFVHLRRRGVEVAKANPLRHGPNVCDARPGLTRRPVWKHGEICALDTLEFIT